MQWKISDVVKSPGTSEKSFESQSWEGSCCTNTATRYMDSLHLYAVQYYCLLFVMTDDTTTCAAAAVTVSVHQHITTDLNTCTPEAVMQRSDITAAQWLILSHTAKCVNLLTGIMTVQLLAEVVLLLVRCWTASTITIPCCFYTTALHYCRISWATLLQLCFQSATHFGDSTDMLSNSLILLFCALFCCVCLLFSFSASDST